MILAALLTLAVTNGVASVVTDSPHYCVAAVCRTQYDDITRYSRDAAMTLPNDAWAVRVGLGTTEASAESDVSCAGLAVRDADGNWTVLRGGRRDTAPRFAAIEAPSESSPARVTVEADVSAGSVIEIMGKTELTDAEWRPADPLCRFFKAVQKEAR